MMTQRSGKKPQDLEQEELILVKWAYYPKESTDLM